MKRAIILRPILQTNVTAVTLCWPFSKNDGCFQLAYRQIRLVCKTPSKQKSGDIKVCKGNTIASLTPQLRLARSSASVKNEMLQCLHPRQGKCKWDLVVDNLPLFKSPWICSLLIFQPFFCVNLDILVSIDNGVALCLIKGNDISRKKSVERFFDVNLWPSRCWDFLYNW